MDQPRDPVPLERLLQAADTCTQRCCATARCAVAMLCLGAPYLARTLLRRGVLVPRFMQVQLHGYAKRLDASQADEIAGYSCGLAWLRPSECPARTHRVRDTRPDTRRTWSLHSVDMLASHH